jgi:hypothetical protein
VVEESGGRHRTVTAESGGRHREVAAKSDGQRNGPKMEVSNRQRRAAGSEGMTRGRKGRLHSLIHVKRRPMPNE